MLVAPRVDFVRIFEIQVESIFFYSR